MHAHNCIIIVVVVVSVVAAAAAVAAPVVEYSHTCANRLIVGGMKTSLTNSILYLNAISMDAHLY